MNKALVPAVALALSLAHASFAGDSHNKAVFVMTNAAAENQILSYSVQADGSLKSYGKYETGGRGSGGTVDPLGSQGSLTLSQDHSLLFAVNAGSGKLSSFRVEGPRLELTDAKPTGGAAPVAVAEHGGLVYVLNFAGNSNVVGFKVDDGYLWQIPSSIRYLSAANSGASSLAFTPDGKFLIVSEKLTNNIDAFPVNPDGTLGTVVTTKDPSAGLFDLMVTSDGMLLTLEAGNASVTPFLVSPTGSLTSLQSPTATMDAGSCWIVQTPNGHFIYVANTASSTISGYTYSAGLLTPIGTTIVATFPTGSVDLDLAISGDGKYLYSTNAGTGTVGMLAIQSDGTLKLIGTLPALGMKSGQNGIAAL